MLLDKDLILEGISCVLKGLDKTNFDKRTVNVHSVIVTLVQIVY